MPFLLQPILKNETVTLRPLEANDFELLYRVASDPLVWEQHPNKDRYQREVFHNFFKGALESGGAFCLLDGLTNEIIGSTRYYDLNEGDGVIKIGYTFLKRSHWGSKFNPVAKKLLLNHAFQYISRVEFHIGAFNIRSQTAISRLGAIKTGEQEIAYYGEQPKLNFIYEIRKSDWLKTNGI
ncbi:MAG: GNAT family N-acetyltransferase [Sediminibacterium sp.]|nr:GNAT family N-acetyltransferase [Sediminibacterium sp.]